MSAIQYQVSIRGRGIRELTYDQAAALVTRTIDGQRPPHGLTVTIQVWREGQALDWTRDHPKAEILRATLRRLLQSKALPLPLRRRPRSRRSPGRVS